MPDELQAWVGHVFVVGGRAVRVPPPGALAERAPRRAARGREGDFFFILVTPHGQDYGDATTYEALSQLAADAYFGSRGGVTGGLREALTAINHRLYHDAANTQHINAVAAVLHGSELYAARSGSAFAVLRTGAGLTFFPEDRLDPLSLSLTPLGRQDTPDIQLTRFEVAPGQVMLLCDAALQHAPTTTFEVALGHDGIANIVNRLRTLSSKQLAVSAIEFAAAGEAAPDAFAIPVSSRDPVTPEPVATRSTSATFDEVLQAETTPPERVPAPAPTPAEGDSPAATPDNVPIPAPTPIADAPHPEAEPPAAIVEVDAEPQSTIEAGITPPFAVEDRQEPQTTPLGEAAPFVADDAARETLEAEQSRPSPLGRIRGIVQAVTTAIQPTPEPDDLTTPIDSGPGRLAEVQEALAVRGRRVLRAILVALVAVIDFVAAVLNRLVPEPEEGERSGIPTNVAIGLAVMIPVVIVMAAIGMALLGADSSKFETYLERAKNAHADAMKLSNGSCDNQALRPLWMEVLRLSEQAQELRPNDATALTIHADAQNYLDCFDDVVRRDITLIHTYPQDADMVSPIVHGGVDLYALDRRNSVVYHNTLNELGNGLSDTGDNPVIWKGQTISGATGNFAVGDIIDIEWLADGGTRPKNVLVALDTNGLLVAYSQTYFTSAQQLVIEGRWQEPVAMAAFRSNLYILDRAANQIWRYVPPAGAESYPNAPEEYFNGDELPDLRGAVDFGISDDGAVYILFADGTVRRYRRNIQGIVEEQPFEFRQRPPGAIVSGAALFVDNDPASRSLYVVDTANEAIYETSWAGTFNQGYRPRNLIDAFKDVSGFYADAVVRNNMYVLAGNKLYHFYRFP